MGRDPGAARPGGSGPRPHAPARPLPSPSLPPTPLPQLASGEVYGRDQPLHLQLLGSERSREALEGVAMELEDSLYPLLREVGGRSAGGGGGGAPGVARLPVSASLCWGW